MTQTQNADAVAHFERERDRHLNQASLIAQTAKGRAMSSNERARMREHTAAGEHFQGKIDITKENEALAAGIDELSRRMATPVAGSAGIGGGDLYAAMMNAGFDRQLHPAVEVGFNTFRTASAVTFDGSYADAVPTFRTSPLLGADRRFLFDVLPVELLSSDETSVSSFRQKSRTLPTLSNMIRDVAAVSEKPEVNTEAELVNEPLHQIAVTTQGVPNVMLEHSGFRSWINEDLRYAYASAVNWHVADEFADASVPTGAPGEDNLEAVLFAAEAVAAAGFNPSVLAASPEFLIDLTLLKQPGSSDYVFSGGAALPLDGLTRVAVAGLDVAYVIDPNAAGTLYVSPVRIATFEENSGQTNTSTVRCESNGLFLVQRLGGIAEVVVGS